MIIEGDSPVHELQFIDSSTLSRAGHVESCLNLSEPSDKAKYSWETDSELVLWRKGEKNPE
jgi:hypothetical protein